jgi:hypothetical protein
MAGLGAPNWRHMFVLIVSLQRMIASRVTIHAARMREDFPDFAKDRPRAIGCVRDRHKLGRAFKLLPGRLLSARWRCNQHRSYSERSSKRYDLRGKSVLLSFFGSVILAEFSDTIAVQVAVSLIRIAAMIAAATAMTWTSKLDRPGPRRFWQCATADISKHGVRRRKDHDNQSSQKAAPISNRYNRAGRAMRPSYRLSRSPASYRHHANQKGDGKRLQRHLPRPSTNDVQGHAGRTDGLDSLVDRLARCMKEIRGLIDCRCGRRIGTRVHGV